jgi:hypothetical protein
MMKIQLISVLVVMLLFSGCDGTDGPSSGTVTLNNELYGSGPYYALGFSFAKAKAISTLSVPAPDITVQAGSLSTGGLVEAFLSTDTFEPAFALKGEYDSESTAVSAFKALASVGTVSYIELGAPLKNNQVWVVRTEDEKYAKIRIIEVTLNTTLSPPSASCKFEWVYQPDGSTTFP